MNGAVDPAVARKVKFFSTISLSLLKTTIIDLCILSFKELISGLISSSWALLFFHSSIAEQKIFDFGSFLLKFKVSYKSSNEFPDQKYLQILFLIFLIVLSQNF